MGGGYAAGLSKGLGRFKFIKSIGRDAHLVLVWIDALRPHEQVVPERVRDLVASIQSKGYFGPPILVEREHYIVLDGHHRVEALKVLGARWAPAIVISYDPRHVSLDSWREGVRVSREEVVKRALSRELFPPKTTRHIVRVSNPIVRASWMSLLKGAPEGVRVE